MNLLEVTKARIAVDVVTTFLIACMFLLTDVDKTFVSGLVGYMILGTVMDVRVYATILAKEKSDKTTTTQSHRRF